MAKHGERCSALDLVAGSAGMRGSLPILVIGIIIGTLLGCSSNERADGGDEPS